MKIRVLLLVAAIFAGAGSEAFARDLDQGTLELQGDFNLLLGSQSSKTTTPVSSAEQDYDSIETSIKAVYYLMPNFGVGLWWDYLSLDVTQQGITEQLTNNDIGPAVTFNTSMGDNASFKITAALASSTIEYIDNSGIDKREGYAWEVIGGLSYYLNSNVSLDGQVGYRKSHREWPDVDVEFDNTGFKTKLGLSVYIR